MVTTNRILPGQARLEQYRTVYSNNYQNQCEKQLDMWDWEPHEFTESVQEHTQEPDLEVLDRSQI